MRIFHLVPNLNYGGLQKVVQLLAARQVQSGHNVTVGCWTNTTNHPEAETELQQAGVRVVYLRRGADGNLSFGRLSLLRTLAQYLGKGNAEILHIHNPFGYYLYGALAARMAGGTKVVNTIHLTAMFDHPRFGRKGRAQFRAAAMLTHRIVAVCAEDDVFLNTRFSVPRKKLRVVENGIELESFLAVPARIRRNEVVFGFAGRMSPEKNHRVLIEAFALARRDHANIRLRLLGGGPLEAELKEQVRSLGLDDIIEFGAFSHDIPSFLAGLDVFILPSIFEALPLSLIEAIASGLPVVATTVGGVPKVVKTTDSGWLCAPDNAKALVEGMESAIAFADGGERAEIARRLVTEHYSAERMTRDYDAVYENVLR